ncbi:MAG: inorganic phosphate transporter [Propionibacteriaceae bacterium]|jgi:PiT family inorganic phosphate transporter|nr:inorganic phosphate transporter [Propionibacteriaceae bacterium]
MDLGPEFWALAALVFVFTYVNGFHDGCNVVATLIASRAMPARAALVAAAVIEVISPFAVLVIGASVSHTVQHLVHESAYTDPAAQRVALAFFGAGILAAVTWNITTWYFALPASSSHALIGGLVGAGLAAFGSGQIAWDYFWERVVLMVFLTPVASFIVGFLMLRLILLSAKRATTRVNTFFKYAQYVNMAFLAFNHSFNDSQKSVGMIMILMSVVTGAVVTSPPLWAIAAAAVALSAGILFGGFRIIGTVGNGIYKVLPVHSFSSQLAAGAVILTSSLVGAPVSSSQIVSSSIMGVGSAEAYKRVRWLTARKILLSWVITIPLAGALGALLFTLFRLIV